MSKGAKKRIGKLTLSPALPYNPLLLPSSCALTILSQMRHLGGGTIDEPQRELFVAAIVDSIRRFRGLLDRPLYDKLRKLDAKMQSAGLHGWSVRAWAAILGAYGPYQWIAGAYDKNRDRLIYNLARDPHQMAVASEAAIRLARFSTELHVVKSGPVMPPPVGLGNEHETTREAAKFITEHPGKKGDAIDRAIGTEPGTFRKHIFQKLVPYGFTSSRKSSYQPPKT